MLGKIKFLALLLVPSLAFAGPGDEFSKPVRLKVGDKAIDVDVGHAAPFVIDMDGDGKKDLLVGQFGAGKLRIFKNVGTDAAPKFESFKWFKAGADVGRVPTG
jgi:hypothetical protein